MARFKVGDQVRILPDPTSRFVNLKGTIREVQPHERGVTNLDRYVVVFSWGEEETFYDVQLAPVRGAGA
jgi:transcription antitermination factor NusG